MFDLIGEPWVPLMDGDGLPVLVSLDEALTNAHGYRAVNMTDPLVGAAVLRLLIAVVIDATDAGDSEGWERAWRAGRLDADAIRTYVQARRDRFDLFHPVHPFMQIPDPDGLLTTYRPAVTLPLEQATGNNVPLFSARTEGDDATLTPAQAAQLLLALHAWDTAGIKTGLPGDPQVTGGKTIGNRTGLCGSLGVVIPTGPTLADTLLLSVVPGKRPAGDRGAWDVDWGPAWQTRQPAGVVELLTWQSRRVRLIHQEQDGRIVVVGCVVAAGDRVHLTPEFEPHTTWTPNKPGTTPATRPARHRVGRAGWQGLPGLLAVRRTIDDPNTSVALDHIRQMAGDDVISEDFPLGVTSVGVEYGTNSTVIEDVIHDQIPLPVVALKQASREHAAHLDTMVTDATATATALNELVNNTRRSCGGDPIAWDKGQRPDVAFYASLSPAAARMLHGLVQEPERLDEALAAWRVLLRQQAWRVADLVLNALPPEAFRGHTGHDAHGEKGAPINQALSEIFFRSALNKALGHPTQEVNHD